MEQIRKEYSVGMLKIKARISDGFVLLVTNQPQVTKEIYNQTKKEGKQVAWYERTQSLAQFYPNKNVKEILEIVDAEVNQVKKEGKNLFKKIKK